MSTFESAADAIVAGDLETLKQLLRDDLSLVRARSEREHGATLLHYVSANGVENSRQKTPQNIVAVAEMLLKAGAEVDAEANMYGGGATTLGLVATSIHPYRAGVQNQLIDLLLDHGAEIDLEAAASLGRLDVVKRSFNDDGTSKVVHKEVQSAFLCACGWGRNNVVEFLLDHGAELNDGGGDGQTPLHCAVITGQLETVKLLLRFKPPLESHNIYGGSVLGQTLWSAAHGGDPKLFSEIIETLIAAGAEVPARHVPVNKEIDDLLCRYGSEPEPKWYWYGEGP